MEKPKPDTKQVHPRTPYGQTSVHGKLRADLHQNPPIARAARHKNLISASIIRTPNKQVHGILLK